MDLGFFLLSLIFYEINSQRSILITSLAPRALAIRSKVLTVGFDIPLSILEISD
jgi:hypothetical protein